MQTLIPQTNFFGVLLVSLSQGSLHVADYLLEHDKNDHRDSAGGLHMK